jgi:hypothetical protein
VNWLLVVVYCVLQIDSQHTTTDSQQPTHSNQQPTINPQLTTDMERENYYLLLELSTDPPENDVKVIEEAIKKKQNQWSRYRNHPTKAIQSKRYIHMIPEMRKIMADPELRKKEAEDAKLLLEEKEKAKYDGIDRHISLLMSKGSITKKEIAKLAKMHVVDEQRIQERVKKKEKFFKIDGDIQNLIKKGAVSDKKVAALAKRYAIGADKVREWVKKKEDEITEELDKCISVCTEKGYITEDEVIRLAKLFSMDEAGILLRAKCPIKKETVSKDSEEAASLDKTIFRLISDNLDIVGKSSLYDFLGVQPNADLKYLQKKAREKEIEIRRIGQKDAVVTASGALTGHCIVIFSSKANRKAYDLAASRSRLSELNSDINAAGIEGKVRSEYFDILLRSALRIDMGLDEAYDYIREYCRKEKWVLKEKKKLLTADKKAVTILEKWRFELNPKKKSFWILAGALVASIIIIIGGVMVGGSIIQASRLKNAYENVFTTMKTEQVLEKKEKVLQDFVNRYEETEYAAEFKKRIREIRKQIEQRDFEDTLKAAESLYAEKKFEDAKAVFEQYLSKYPKSSDAGDIKKRLSEIPGLIDDRDYEEIAAAATGDYAEQIKLYNRYFKEHPEGRHISEVKRLIADMIGEYYNTLINDLKGCEAQQNWEKCIELCDEFVGKFDGTEQASRVAGMRITFEKRIQYRNDLADLKIQAEQMGIDYDGAKNLYVEYMTANPESPAYVKEVVARAVAELDRKHKQYLQEEREWEELTSLNQDPMVSVGDKLKRFEGYVPRAPERYAEDAGIILSELQRKKRLVDENTREKREKIEWVRVATYCQNAQVSLSDKIQAAEKYIAENPSAQYIADAKSLLEALQAEKAAEDARLKADAERKDRIQNEVKRISALVKKAGRFAANRNGTVTDRKTGLTWCMIDSYVDLGRCLDFDSSKAYVSALRTGGYADWRLPTANELVGIYKNSPYFPGGAAPWYWTSDILWHGWNKKAHIVTSKRETAWDKDQAELNKCGAVRAVR